MRFKKPCFVLAAGMTLALGDASGVRAEGAEKVWEATGLAGPESALYDPNAGVIYVSTVDGEPLGKDGKGWIAKVSPDGKTITKDFVTGLNAPMGLAISGGKLFVPDIDELVEINLADGKVVARYPAAGVGHWTTRGLGESLTDCRKSVRRRGQPLPDGAGPPSRRA